MFKRALFTGTAMLALVLGAPVTQAQDAVPAPAETSATPAPDMSAILSQSSGGSAVDGGVIQLQVGKSHVLKDIKTYEITNPAIVEAQPTPEGDLILNARSAGTTTLLVEKTGALGYFRYEVTVTGVDVENVLQVVKAALGGIVGLQISQEGNVVVLQGEVANRDDGVRIDRQKEMFGNTIIDLTKRTYLQAGLILLKDELGRTAFRDISAETRLNSSGDEVLMLRGTVYSQAQLDQLNAIANRFFQEDRVVNQVRIDSPQVEVDIEVYSFDLGRARRLGNNTLLDQISRTTSDGWVFQTGPRVEIDATATQADLDAARVTKHTTKYPVVTLGAEVDQFLDAHNIIAAASDVSRQHASVRSGDSAKVDNIQEDNIEIATGFAAALEQVTYGQTLTIQPTILGDNLFETIVTIEMSNPVTGPSASAISVARRTLSSVFNSEQNQTVVLGGTKNINTLRTHDSTPFLAHIPIVNWWFRDKNDANAETIQVFMMTLHAPSVLAATEQAQSVDAQAVKDSTMRNYDRTKGELKNRHRWEAEGLETLWTGESKFE